jgi:hypothetical protein
LVDDQIDRRLLSLQELVGGYDFAAAIKAYWRGSEQGDEALKGAALRWVRGEFPTKTEARQAMGVRSIIDDDNVYDGMKLLSAFVRLAGYTGLLVVFDELVNLYKLQSAHGPRDPGMTMDLYGHLWSDPVGDQALADASERLMTSRT